MEHLSTTHAANGYEYEQVWRKGMTAIYKQLRTEDTYEVIKIKISPASEVFGKSYPEREVYPGNEEWGKLAWTVRGLKEATTLADKEAQTDWDGITHQKKQ